MSDKIVRAFNRFGATWAVALDIPRPSTGFDLLILFTNSMEIKVRYLRLSSFLINKLLCMVLDGKSAQYYPVNAGVPKAFNLSPTLFLPYINNHLDTTFYCKCEQVSDLWQQELASELKSGLRGAINWSSKCLEMSCSLQRWKNSAYLV